MADVHKAYSFLSKSMGLNLTDAGIVGHERVFKAKWLKENGFSVPENEVDDWEFFLHIQPRKGKGDKPAED